MARLNILFSSLLAISISMAAVIDGNDTVSVINGSQTYPLGFIREDSGIRMFWFSDTLSNVPQNMETDRMGDSFYIGQKGGQKPDATLLMIAAEEGTFTGGCSLGLTVEDLDGTGSNPVTVLDTVFTGPAFQDGYGPQVFKPHFAEDSTGLPIVTGLSGVPFMFFFVSIPVTFIANQEDYIRVTWQRNDCFFGRLALNVYGYRQSRSALIWTNDTGVTDTTSSYLITAGSTGINITSIKPELPGDRDMSGWYDVLGRRADPGQRGIYFKWDRTRRSVVKRIEIR